MAEKKPHCSVIPCSYDDDSFVFVSYDHKDAGVVFPIIERVGAGGYAIWYDRGITVSSTWSDEIAIAIMKCKAFLLFASKNSVNSTYVRAEIEYALNNKLKVIPIYLDGIDVLPPGLALGLNATQGITDIDTPQFVANQICNALIYNKVRRHDGRKGTFSPVEYPPDPPKRPWGKYLAAGALAACLILAVVLFGFLGQRSASSVAPDRSASAQQPSPPALPEAVENGNLPITATESVTPQEQVQIPETDTDLAQEKSTSVPEESVAFIDPKETTSASNVNIDIRVPGVPRRMIKDGERGERFPNNFGQGNFEVHEPIRGSNNGSIGSASPANRGNTQFRHTTTTREWTRQSSSSADPVIIRVPADENVRGESGRTAPRQRRRHSEE
jgi:hypothetical protein